MAEEANATNFHHEDKCPILFMHAPTGNRGGCIQKMS